MTKGANLDPFFRQDYEMCYTKGSTSFHFGRIERCTSQKSVTQKCLKNWPRKSPTWCNRKTIIDDVVALEVDHDELKPNGIRHSIVSTKQLTPHINF